MSKKSYPIILGNPRKRGKVFVFCHNFRNPSNSSKRLDRGETYIFAVLHIAVTNYKQDSIKTEIVAGPDCSLRSDLIVWFFLV